MNPGQWLLHPVRTWKDLREARLERGLRVLKYRYQIFRALLEDNHRAVTLVTEIGAKLRTGNLSPILGEKVRELDATVAEMIEKQNHLSEAGIDRLTSRHQKISAALDLDLKALPEQKSSPFCLALADIETDMRQLVGGKSATLAELGQSDEFNVPGGFVITASACRFFLEEQGIMLSILSKLLPTLERKQIPAETELKEIRESILAASPPPSFISAVTRIAEPFFRDPGGIPLAVRSSALSEDSSKHSFAGQYKTVLNVTTMEDLLQAVKEVIASSFNSRNISYRLHAGLDPLEFDLAVLCLEMVDAVSSGTLFTRDPNDPERKTMLISALFGLGELAVSGGGNADIYYPHRFGDKAPQPIISRKEKEMIPQQGGGTRLETVTPERQNQAVLSEQQQKELVQAGLVIEKKFAFPQDIEWAYDRNGKLVILQSRPFHFGAGAGKNRNYCLIRELLLQGGMAASRGEGIGRAHIIQRREDFQKLPDGPVILVLHQSLADAVEILERVAAVIVDLGNPVDHLSCIAREYDIPMLTGAEHATKRIPQGSWIFVNANEGQIFRAAEEEIRYAMHWDRDRTVRMVRHDPIPENPVARKLYESIVPLHLTDAYGPTFSIQECRSLHDIIRYIHEKAVLAMFESGDELIELTGTSVRHLRADVPFYVSMIDLGGGLDQNTPAGRYVQPEHIRSVPLASLWRGVMTPGLHWGPPAGGAAGGPMSNWMTDHRAGRPIGMPNYAIITRDYLNLNARMDFHFIMVDALCGLDPRGNYVRFRFKGGGTTLHQRRRRILCIAEILENNGFLCNRQDDLVTAALQGGPVGIIEEKLVMVGRLLGFTRLLDAAMVEDSSVSALARAFLNGDYALEMVEVNPAVSQA